MPAYQASLTELGWTPFFSAQLSAADKAGLCPVRVMAVHRGKLAVAGVWADAGAGEDGAGQRLIPPYIAHAPDEEAHATVGDWLLIDEETSQISRILHRANMFKRRTPGNVRKVQLIAANVDTLFIVTSCNQDFNIARLERYLVLAGEVGVTPVIVLTKADLTTATDALPPEALADAARELQPGLRVEIVNAKDPLSVARLAAWCGKGQTVALLGSSGVGKSTLINTLTGSAGTQSANIATQAVREADGRGRHTTTVRQMHRLAQGGWLMDTPGMRELHLSDAAEGLAEVFDDIVTLAGQCRFSNCSHEGEPDCAVQAALVAGGLDAERVARWRKLTAQDGINTGRGRR